MTAPTGKPGAELVPAVEYVLTTEQVRESVTHYRHDTWTEHEFDRWLAQHDRQVTVQALRDARNEFAAAGLRGVEPVLNHAVAEILHRRAQQIERGL